MTASRRSQVPPFAVMSVLQRVAALRAAGRDVISLCAGEPSQGAPADVRHRAEAVLADRLHLGYSETFGLLSLREALAGHYRRWYDLDVDPAQIALTTGSSGAFTLVFLAAFEAGDRVALARPGYPAYANILRTLGCQVVDLDCGEDVRFQPTPALLSAAHASAPLAGVVVASPANPTGTMLDAGQLGEVARWCREHDVRLISDEIYHGVTYTGSVGVCAWRFDQGSSHQGSSHQGSSHQGSVVISSFSKFWGMTGWRLGWCLLPEDLVAAVDALAGNFALCPPVPAQHAALAAFTENSYAEAEAAVGEFADARGVLLDALRELRWTRVAPADGAFYLYADVGDVLGPYRDSEAWCAALLDTEGVALTPGTDFDRVHGHSAVRVSLAAGPEAVAAALIRILRFQRSLA